MNETRAAIFKMRIFLNEIIQSWAIHTVERGILLWHPQNWFISKAMMNISKSIPTKVMPTGKAINCYSDESLNHLNPKSEHQKEEKSFFFTVWHCWRNINYAGLLKERFSGSQQAALSRGAWLLIWADGSDFPESIEIGDVIN